MTNPHPDLAPTIQPVVPQNLLGNSLRAQILRNFAQYPGPAAPSPWRPPLRTPHSVDHLLQGYQHEHMSFPVAMIDRPFYADQRPWTISLTGQTSSVAIGGLPLSGKTTFLQTLIVSGAWTHSPEALQFFCLDFSSGGLTALSALPHVASVATSSAPHRVRRTLAQLTATSKFRGDVMGDGQGLSWASYLRARQDPNHPASQDPYAEIVFVIDGWDNVVAEDWMPEDSTTGEHDKYIEQIYSLARLGASRGIHVAIGLNRWTTLRANIRSSIGLKIDLFPADKNDTGIEASRIVDEIPPKSPGRALSTGARDFDGLIDDAYMDLMIGAPRLDGQNTMADLDQTYEATTAAISARWQQAKWPPKMAMLPAQVPYTQVAAKVPAAAPQDPEEVRWNLPIGLSESTLDPLMISLKEHPHVLVFGEDKSGKSASLRTIAKAITDRNTPQQVQFIVVDYEGSLEDVVPDEYMVPNIELRDAEGNLTGQVAHTYIRNYLELEKSVPVIRAGLEPRRQPSNVPKEAEGNHSWWDGPEIILLIDDWHQVITNHPAQYAALAIELAEFIQSRTAGFHFIASCSSAQMYVLVSTNRGALGVAWSRGGHILIHSGNIDEYPAKEIAIRKRRPGEALYIRRRKQIDIVQIADPSQ